MKALMEFEKIASYEALIESKMEEIMRQDALVKKITAALGGETVCRSRNLDPLGTAIAKKEKLEIELAALLVESNKHTEFLKAMIDSLEKPIHIKVLYGLYLNGKKLAAIAEDEGYTYRNICYIHDDALLAIEEILKKS